MSFQIQQPKVITAAVYSLTAASTYFKACCKQKESTKKDMFLTKQTKTNKKNKTIFFIINYKDRANRISQQTALKNNNKKPKLF